MAGPGQELDPRSGLTLFLFWVIFPPFHQGGNFFVKMRTCKQRVGAELRLMPMGQGLFEIIELTNMLMKI